jgi:hypothetical protein
MDELRELEFLNKSLKNNKHDIDSDLQSVRNFLKERFFELRSKDPKLSKFEYGGMRVELVPKKHQCKPTIQMGYAAIKNVLGEQALMLVKDRVESLKKYRKEHAKKQKSISMVRMGELRKPTTKTIQKRMRLANQSKVVSEKIDLKPAKAIKKTEKKPKFIKRKSNTVSSQNVLNENIPTQELDTRPPKET